MESDSITSESLPSHPSSPHVDHPPASVFTLTREDTALLSEYIEEFQEGDADMRSTIVANAMAELVLLRPPGSPFNKDEASKVGVTLLIFVYLNNELLHAHRKSANGFTTITIGLKNNTLNSSDDGLPGMRFTTCVVTKL
jgi:hypothetical protein